MACPCGPSSWKCRIPFLFRLHTPQFCFKPACQFHDQAYTQGGSPTDRFLADHAFLGLMLCRIAAKPWPLRVYYTPFAYLYYWAVRHYGGKPDPATGVTPFNFH